MNNYPTAWQQFLHSNFKYCPPRRGFKTNKAKWAKQ